MPTSTHQIVINESHYDASSNSYIYPFRSEQDFIAGDLIGVKSASIFHSFFNVEAPNNIIKIDFPSGASDWITTGNYEVEPGFYDAKTFSSYLQSIMYSHKMYSELDNKFYSYLFMGESSIQYANTITTYAVSTSVIPPAGATWSQLQGTPRSPRIFLGALGPRFGFASDATITTSYGYTEETTKVQNSIITPQINPFNSIILISPDCVFNPGFSYPSSFLFSMSLSSSFGGLLVSPNSQTIYNQIRPGKYNSISIRICDSTVKPLTLRDTNISLVLTIIKTGK